MPQLQDLTSDMGLTKSDAHRGTKKKKDEIIIWLYIGFGESPVTIQLVPQTISNRFKNFTFSRVKFHTHRGFVTETFVILAPGPVSRRSQRRLCFPDTQSFTLGVFSSQHAKHHQNDISYLEREIKSRFNALEFIGTENSDINQFLLLLF